MSAFPEMLDTKISRRRFLNDAAQLSLAAAAGFSTMALTGCNSSEQNSDRQLNILNWAAYLHPDTISQFEKRYQVNVVQDTFASNEALLAKLQAGGTRYDVIVPSSYMVKLGCHAVGMCLPFYAIASLNQGTAGSQTSAPSPVIANIERQPRRSSN